MLSAVQRQHLSVLHLSSGLSCLGWLTGVCGIIAIVYVGHASPERWAVSTLGLQVSSLQAPATVCIVAQDKCIPLYNGEALTS